MQGSNHPGTPEQVVWALRALGGEATVGDLISVTGLARPEVERALEVLIARNRSHVRVLERGDLTYRIADPPEGAPIVHGRAAAGRPRPVGTKALTRARRAVFDRRTLRLIRARGGVLSLAELVEQTGLKMDRADREMRRIAAAWGGEPHIGLDGHTVYAFPELMRSVHGRFAAREPRPAWVAGEDPMDHAREGARHARIGMLTLGLGGAMVASLPLLAGMGTAAALAFAGVGGVLVTAGGRAVLRHHRRFRFRQPDTLRRYALGYVVETALAGKGVVSLQRTVRFIQGRAGRRTVSRTGVEAALRELAAEFDAPITREGEDLFFGFRKLKRQFLASHLLRRQLSMGHTVVGRTVFDTADSPEVAWTRDFTTSALDSDTVGLSQPPPPGQAGNGS